MAVKQLSKYPWKGNIRELRNIMEKAVLLSENSLLRPVDFAPYPGAIAGGEEENLNLETNERRLIEKALEKNRFNKKLAAEVLGINRTTLYNKIRKYGIESI